MEKQRYNIVVTGVGALIGQGIIKGLRQVDGVVIYGVDRVISPYAKNLVDVALQKPDCDEESGSYLEFWAKLIVEQKIDLILPGISLDMYFFDANRDVFANYDVKIALNDQDLIKNARDKYIFDGVYKRSGLPNIPTARPDSWKHAIDILGAAPLLLKPRFGEGSTGIARLLDEVDFKYWTQKSADNWIIQKIIGSDTEEYTVGIFGLGDGTASAPIIFRRKLSRSGYTQDAEVVMSDLLNDFIKKIVTYFKPIGPTNLQFRLEDNIPYLLEINPRFSSSCSLRYAFGFNEAAMCVEYYLNNKSPSDATIKFGRAQRYNEDYISYVSDII